MNGLATVTVRKSELLERLKENRALHHDEYEKAMTAYRTAAIQELSEMQQVAEYGGEIRRSLTLPEPQDHTDDYDRIIDMVDMEVADTIELTSEEFAKYVRDDWGWKHGFTQTASFYK